MLAESTGISTSFPNAPSPDEIPERAAKDKDRPHTTNDDAPGGAAIRITSSQSTTPASATTHRLRPSGSVTVYSTPTAHHLPHSTHPVHPDIPPDTPTRPRPVLPPPPPNIGNDPPPSSKHQSAVAIAFEVIAGVVGSFLLFMMTRCFISWRRTPNRDRIEGLLSRHYLEREMAERERQEMEQRILRSSSLLRPPPPPYISAPAYEEIAGDRV